MTVSDHLNESVVPAGDATSAGAAAGGDNGDATANPLVRIRSLLPELARAEQRVAKVVLDDPGAVAGKSITEVAIDAHTSETTVTRFCKAIGVGGYPQLRIALAADNARTLASTRQVLSGDIDAADDVATVVSKIGFADARAVEDTAEQLPIGVLERVIDAIVDAGRIDIYALGADALVAAELQHKLHRLAKVSFSWSDPELMHSAASVLTTGDVAVAISHSGATNTTIDALRTARAAGATTVTLTNFPRSPLATIADHALTTAARETTFRSGAAASRVAQLTVIDCLFTGVAQRLGATAADQSTSNEVPGQRHVSRQDDQRRSWPTIA